MKHPFLFLFPLIQHHFGQVYAGQWEGEGAALQGCCSQGLGCSGAQHPLAASAPHSPEQQGSITGDSRTHVRCCSVILHLWSSASFRLMFIHNLLLLFSTFGVSLQDKAIFLWLDSLFRLKIYFTSCCSCPSRCKKCSVEN